MVFLFESRAGFSGFLIFDFHVFPDRWGAHRLEDALFDGVDAGEMGRVAVFELGLSEDPFEGGLVGEKSDDPRDVDKVAADCERHELKVGEN